MSGSLPHRWPAPAKINLFLHVTGVRADGYHALQTLFQFVDLCDEVRLEPRGDGVVRRLAGAAGVSEEADLAVRAARLIQAHCGVSLGVDISVAKRIPMGAGLGGGSSDCATVLHGLNRIWDLGLGTDELARLGRRLGADVPVFVRGRAAVAEGVGDLLTPVPLPEPWYLILVPGCHVSTAEVFASPALTRNSAPMKIRDWLAHTTDVRDLLRATCNDCEAVVRATYPEVGDALGWLRAEPGVEPRMTGTGSAVFAPFEREADARALGARVPANWSSFVGRGMNTSPLLECVRA